MHAEVSIDEVADQTATQFRVLTVDTAAGPCLIDDSTIPPEMRHKIEPCSNMSLLSATNHRQGVSKMIRLYIKIGDLRVPFNFGIVPNLPPGILVGTALIDKYIKNIEPLDQLIRPINSRPVPIIARNTTTSTSTVSAIHTPKPLERFHNLDVESPIRVAKQVTIPAGHQRLVTVTCKATGPVSLIANDKPFATRRCQMANGIAELEEGKSFYVWVANFSKKPQHLPKHMTIGAATSAPNIVHHNPNSTFRQPPDESVLTVTMKKLKETFEDSAFRHEIAEQAKQEHTEADWKDVVDIGEDSKKYKQKLISMLEKHSAMWDGHLGHIHATKHRIELTPGAKPVYQQPYRASPTQREHERKEIEKMLTEGVIEPSTSEWAAPVVFAPKKDGTLRFCVDYRRLNAVTLRDSYPIPRMDECIDSLGDAKIFSTLDCNSGYWQIEIDEDDQEKTAFVTHQGLYHFTRMPFGLRNAPATFQRAVDIVLSSVRWQFCIVYLDDVIIFSNSVDEHIDHIDQVLTLLENAGMSIRLKKSFFMHKEIEYLGHIITPGELKVAQKTITAIQGMEPPRTKTEVKSFLGMCNVYRRFVKDFATISAPLNALVRKNAPDEFDLREEQLAAFKTLKEKLQSPSVLALPRAGLPYVLDTDANDTQVGCVLQQKYEDNSLRPIGYYSRTLNDTEKKYDTTERECLGIIWAVLLLRPYLEMERFTLRTDHEALKWLFDDNSKGAKLDRWRLRLQQFDFDVAHLPGKQNRVADALSRIETSTGDQRPGFIDVEIPVLETERIFSFDEDAYITPDLDTVDAFAMIEDDTNPSMSDMDEIGLSRSDSPATLDPPAEPIPIAEFVTEQRKDPYCIEIAKSAGSPKSEFTFNNQGVLVRVSKFDGAIQQVVPKSLQDRVIHLSYSPLSQGHPGESRLYSTMRLRFLWPFMYDDLVHHVRNCRTCVQAKGVKGKKQHKTKLFPPTGPLDDIAIDLLGPLPRTKNGNSFIAVITDRYSKLTRAIPMKETTAPFMAATLLNNWIIPYGIPNSILSDNGPQFVAEFWKTTLAILGINHKTTTSYHPQTNGQAERYNKTIVSRLRHYVSEHQDNWDKFVQTLTYAYNSQVHRSTGTSPFSLTITRIPPCPIIDAISTSSPSDMNTTPSSRTMRIRILDKLKSITSKSDVNSAKAHMLYKKYADRTIKHLPVFKPGDYVFLLRPPTEPKSQKEKEEERAQSKLRFKTTGPFKVVDASAETVTILEDGLHLKVSIDRCIKDPKQYDENRQARDDPDNQPLLLSDDTPTDQSEVVFRHDPTPSPLVHSAAVPSTILSHSYLRNGEIRLTVRFDDGSTGILPTHALPRRILDPYFNVPSRQSPNRSQTFRRRGRGAARPMVQPRASSRYTPASLRRYSSTSRR